MRRFTALACLLLARLCVADTTPVTIAVLDFEAVNTASGDAVVMAGFVRTAVVKSGVFNVVERQKMQEVLSEQALQQTGCTDEACIVKLGKVLNAKKVLTGSLSLLGADRFLSVRMVDVETGRIEWEETSESFQLKEAKRVADGMAARLLAAFPAGSRVSATVSAESAGGFVPRDGAPMVLVPAGEFVMGTPGGDSDEKPAHRATLSAFWLDRYEVTNTLYADFLNAYGRDTDDEGHKTVFECEWGVRRAEGRWVSQPGYENHPVVAVTWYGAAAYAKYYGERLPTEAEWEYACRAGAVGKWCFGDDVDRLAEVAWYGGNAGDTTHPVGVKEPNRLGLYDMHGNAWEWVADWFAPYAKDAVRDPAGPDSGEFKLLRGGSWKYSASWSRSAFRNRVLPGSRNNFGGFRCAASAPPAK